MANQETKQLDSIISSRRAMLAVGGAALAGLAFAPKAEAATINDNDILNFALNLEYLEAQFYNLAVYGVTIDKLPTPIPVAVNGGTAGTVTLKPNFTKVPFVNGTVAAYAKETATEEGKHVLFLQAALGKLAVSMPNIDLYNSFNALATKAGLGSSVDPFANDMNFLLGAYVFEDVGVTAYQGAAGLITDKKVVLPAAASILAVEAYHAGLIRTTISQMDGGVGTYSGYTQLISSARAQLANGGSTTKIDDVGVSSVAVSLNAAVTTPPTAPAYPSITIADADSNKITFPRTTAQILAIVTGGPAPASGPSKGVFFPSGMNGTIQ